MRIFKLWEQLEKNEDLLRQRVNELPEEKKKIYYQLQATKLKDPDTYAALNWFFLGGFHHLYLGKYTLFIIEITLLIFCLIEFVLGYQSAVFILGAIVLYELPQLFFSQKIARQHNYDVSCEIFNDVRRN